jgi:Ca2+-transporting ATPase
LDDRQVAESRSRYGVNQLVFKKDSGLIRLLKGLLHEPMILLLLTASALYFITGAYGDGIFMAAAIVMVSAISIYQRNRTKAALEKLKTYVYPKCKVIRNKSTMEIDSAELVVGDIMIIEEGNHIPADGTIIRSNDFSVNESVITGESLAVHKDPGKDNNLVYSGTMAASGLAIIRIDAVGNDTKLGQIGKSMEAVSTERSPLEKQINDFVKKLVLIGMTVFLIVWAVNYFTSRSVLDSLLKALTLAMSILPEEIPVAFTTFMALGAWRLMKMGIVVKQMKTIETLGSATVICTDKTGTLTANQMQLTRLYTHRTGTVSAVTMDLTADEKDLLSTAMWASEPIPFDPMEKSIHEWYAKTSATDERTGFRMIHEYPLGGKPPMMTHVFENKNKDRIIAAKGAPEAILKVSGLQEAEQRRILEYAQAFGRQGYRVLGVASAHFEGDQFPGVQQDLPFTFRGLVAFNDPPKPNIGAVLDDFYRAGIKVKIVTGDSAETTKAIAKEIGLRNFDESITGEELMALSDASLRDKVERIAIFSRMFPDAKLRIINALKQHNEIVAMTGDGVNDGPALKAAHIGIAMGKKGTEIARQAASLILTDDDLSRMVDAIRMGRKIYANLKKAVQYIISIHIPIILTVFVPLVAGWVYPNIFTPVHVIFFELIMGPTCSIIYENEPIEKNAMLQRPRPFTKTFFNGKELATSILQGLMIACGALLTYRVAVRHGANEATTRTMVFVTLIVSNIFLTLVNRSFYYSIFTTIRYRNRLVPLIIFLTISLTVLFLYVDPLTAFFRLQRLRAEEITVALTHGFIFVIWFELVKLFRRIIPTKAGRLPG